MDKAKSIYLTAKVSVTEGNDILSMTMKAVTGYGGSNNQSTPRNGSTTGKD